MKSFSRRILGLGFIFLAGCSSCQLQVQVECGDGQVTKFTCTDPGSNPPQANSIDGSTCDQALANAQKACASSVPNKQF